MGPFHFRSYDAAAHAGGLLWELSLLLRTATKTNDNPARHIRRVVRPMVSEGVEITGVRGCFASGS